MASSITILLLFLNIYSVLSQLDCECGIENKKRDGHPMHEIDAKIINGRPADPYQYPWLVYLEIVNYPNVVGCTGSIINDRYIATAAHCVNFEKVTASDVFAWNGPICAVEKLKKTKPLDIKRIIKHEKYTGISSYHDIALLELREPLTFNKTFSPICLPSITHFKNFFVAGWGLINVDFPGAGPTLVRSECLNEAELLPRTWLICKVHYGLRVPTSQVFCAGGKTGTCMGDSGGPLMSRVYGRVYEAGITSHGKSDCGVISEYPGVFEKITYHSDWILKHTSNAKWCRGPFQIIN